MVDRRGSTAPTLDRHPPGWSGKDEARFRYGVEEADIPDGYTFALEENGELTVRRLDASLEERYFNPASGTFEPVDSSVIRAKLDPLTKETKALSELTPEARANMDASFAKRNELIVERDRLEALEDAGTITNQEAERLSKVRAEINDASRRMGETAADDVMRVKGGKLKYPLNKTHSTAGDFDRVYEVGDELWVVEVKGGGGALGTRTVGVSARAEQGTLRYFDSVVDAMSKSSSQEAFEAALALQEAKAAGKVRYLLVRAPIGTTAGQAALRDVQIGEFVLK